MRSEKSKETPPLPGMAGTKQECYSTQRREIAEISAEKTKNRVAGRSGIHGFGGGGAQRERSARRRRDGAGAC